jgi:hypothetical protein
MGYVIPSGNQIAIDGMWSHRLNTWSVELEKSAMPPARLVFASGLILWLWLACVETG